LPQAAIMVALFVVVTMGIIAVVQGQRKIPVQYAKRVVGQQGHAAARSSFLPLEGQLLRRDAGDLRQRDPAVPAADFLRVGAAFNIKFLTRASQNLLRGHWTYYHARYACSILFFSYFWVSVMFKPIQIADDLKKYGGYIPGVRPGEPTAQFLDFIMTRLTLAGAIFLTVIAVMPDVLLFELERAAAHRRTSSAAPVCSITGRRHPRYDAPDRDLPPSAPLRRLPEEGPHPCAAARNPQAA